MNTIIDSGVKFILSPTPEQYELLSEYCVRYRKLFNMISKVAHKEYLLDDGKCIYAKDGLGTKMAICKMAKKLKERFTHEFSEQEFCFQTLRWSIVYAIANRYSGYYRRNRKRPHYPIMMSQSKAILYKHKIISQSDEYITLPIHGQSENGQARKLKIKCVIPKAMSKNLSFLPVAKSGGHCYQRFGGTLDRKRGTFLFIAQAKVPWMSNYEPSRWIGYDIGKKNFLYFSEDINGKDHLLHNDKQIAILNRISNLLKIINDRSIKSNVRSLFRRRWLNAQKEHKKILRPIADNIISHVLFHNCGLALDSAKFGASMGSSGQEITEILRSACVSLHIPFYLSSCAYTSQTCPSCGYVSKKNRNQEEFKCISCGYINHADKVGAINTAKQAEKWYNNNGACSTVK